MARQIYKLAFLGLTLLFLLAACSTVVQTPMSKAYSTDVAEVVSGKLILGHAVTLDELPNPDIFAITPEMAAFAEKAIERADDSSYEKVRALHVALLGSTAVGGRHITYNAYSTDVPIQTFESRRANCLSFTLLYVAMARHVGINAKVNEVEIPPTWDYRSRNSMIFLRHVNVYIRLRTDTLRPLKSQDAIVDLEMERYKAHYSQRVISDDLTAAQFFSNRAMEFSANGNFKDAFLHLRKALEENNRQSYVWNNLGSLYQRSGLMREAEIAYLHGLSINDNDLSIITNLASLYSKLGNKTLAAHYGKLALRHRQTNPYYQYMLALSAFDDGDTQNALVYVKRALNRYKNEPRFYELAASVYEQMGKTSEAAMMTRKREGLIKGS